MVAIKAHFDGKTIIVPEDLRGAPAGDVLIIFQGLPHDLEEKHGWMKAQEPAFAKAWDNDEDAVYDSL
jgi:hypothetical protein